LSSLDRSFAARHPEWAYVAPFAVLLAFLALAPRSGFAAELAYPLRVVAVSSALLIWSRHLLKLAPSRPVASVILGLAVFVVWIGPDLLWPGYRAHWLFQNPVTGELASSIAVASRTNVAFLAWRGAGLILLVPVTEELFWRGWLMRYAIARRFQDVPLGAYSAGAFWLTAALFASEHGPYWDVGLAAGVAYNYWMIRTRSLADCILAHAVTNAALLIYVLWSARWEYLL
jgi:CAAX prenyl protease-like protein